MPVTARLSQELYNRLGERVVTELVDWLNSVDATYRADLRELNELNFARFDAKLEQRIGAVEHSMAALRDHLDVRFAEQEVRFAEQDARLNAKLFEASKWFIVAWVAQTAAILGLWVVR